MEYLFLLPKIKNIFPGKEKLSLLRHILDLKVILLFMRSKFALAGTLVNNLLTEIRIKYYNRCCYKTINAKNNVFRCNLVQLKHDTSLLATVTQYWTTTYRHKIVITTKHRRNKRIRRKNNSHFDID